MAISFFAKEPLDCSFSSLMRPQHLFFQPFCSWKDFGLTLLAPIYAPFILASIAIFTASILAAVIVVAPFVCMISTIQSCRGKLFDASNYAKTGKDALLITSVLPIISLLSIPIALLRIVARACATLFAIASECLHASPSLIYDDLAEIPVDISLP